MSSLFINPFVRPLGTTGEILPFGKLYFYLTGTTTEAPVYDDDGDEYDQPVLADVTGAFPNVYTDTAITYRVQLRNAAGVLQGDADPAASISALNLFYEASGSDAVAVPVQTKLQRYIDAKDDGATGAGAVDDHTALANALSDYGAAEIFVPYGVYINRTALSPDAGTDLRGSRGTIIKTDTSSNHVFLINAADIAIRNFTIQGTNGAGVHINSAIGFSSGAARTVVHGVEASGMSGSPFFGTGGPTYCQIGFSYVHGMAGSYQNSAAIDLYSTATAFTNYFNLLDGTGTGTEVGILNQLTSTRHAHIGNRIAAFTGFGAIDYDNTPRATYTLFALNEIKDIAGTINGGTAGMGIYIVDTGGQRVIGNDISNCNVSTSTESLTPGGIGINEGFSPIVSGLNQIHGNNWYGLMVGTTSAVVSSVGDVFFENAKDQVFYKNTNNGHIVAASITALTAATAVRCVNINVGVAADVTGNMMVGIRSRGGGATARAWETARSSQMVISGVSHSDCAGSGLYIYGGAATFSNGNAIGDSIYDVSSGNNIALTLNRVKNTVIDNIVLKTGGAIALQIADTSTGVRIGKNVAIFASGAWQAEPMNFIDNQGAGCIVEAYGSAAPTVLTHKVGDIVWNTAPAAAGTIGWVCTTAGTPGTWKTWGTIAA